MKKTTLIAALFVLMTCQASADVSVAILKGEAVGEKQAGLSVSALDEAGRPIKGLTRNDFQLLIGGEQVDDFSVEPASTTDEPLSIVLGLDVSGSMWGAPFRETQKAISIFLDQLETHERYVVWQALKFCLLSNYPPRFFQYVDKFVS